MVYIFVTICDKEIKGGVCHEVIQIAPRGDGSLHMPQILFASDFEDKCEKHKKRSRLTEHSHCYAIKEEKQ